MFSKSEKVRLKRGGLLLHRGFLLSNRRYWNFSEYEVSITVSTCHPENQAEKCDRKLFFTSLNAIYIPDKNCENP